MHTPSNPFDAMLDDLAWRALDLPPATVIESAPASPFPTHEGYLTIGAARLRVLRLSDGQGVIDQAGVTAAPQVEAMLR